MPGRSRIKGVLCGFLGSFTSRYSDYEGYWLFGMLGPDLEEMTLDLLEGVETASASGVLAAARQRAKAVFREQLRKGGFDLSQIREARVVFRRSPEAAQGLVSGHVRSGRRVEVTARAVSDLNRVYVATTSVFVAPHDPRIELRSRRATRQRS